MRKILKNRGMAFLCAGIFLIFSVSVSGNSMLVDQDKTDWILSLWGLSGRQLVWEDPDGDSLGTLVWTGEQIGQARYTFSKQLDLTGTAEPGTIIYYGILTEERNDVSIWEKFTVEVGSAGLIQERISLPKMGTQYIAVLVQEAGTDELKGTIYTVCRKSQLLEEELKDFEVNLYGKYARGAVS